MSDGTERWLPVVGYAGYYEVSSEGRVRSLDRWVPYTNSRKLRFWAGQIRKTSLVKGYPHLILKRQDRGLNVYVHTLVCEAFYGPRPAPDWEVRHLNGDPLDNRAANIAWGTKKQNAQDSIRHGTNKELNRTECKYGHPFNEANTIRYPSRPTRVCRTCKTASSRKYTQDNRVASSVRARARREAIAAAEGRRLRTHRNSLYERARTSQEQAAA